MTTTSAAAQRSASLSSVAAPSSSTTRTLPPRPIRVVIPSAQTSTRVKPHPAFTVKHGHALIASANDEVLHAEWTPTRGHGDFVIPSPHDSPSTPTNPRISARTRRRSSLFFASSDADVEASPHSPGAEAGGLVMSPMEEESGEHTHEGHGDDGHAASAEDSGAEDSLGEAHVDAPLLGAT
ncbi:hypothetical protein TRAPUB_11742 [Trametes pubescens]|uniref:Uncharacterized protein n=1 Tax=Trametes pubescens TaxID=154538 RepID=A0A1M2VVW3_TRAPU|nr:hypothetical protein TRAPUB_11742 [Trametes pubescens]